MFKQGAPNTQFQTYDWVSNAINSTLKFPVPKAGEWIFKLFPERNFIGPYIEAASCSILIPGKDTLNISFNGAETYVEYDIQTLDPAIDRVWIGIFFESSTSDRDYRRFRNISTSSKGRLLFKTPIHQGTYNARLFGNGSSTPLIKSDSITVPDATN
jgi:hypothetical protein